MMTELLYLLIATTKTVAVRTIDRAPVIDGVLENQWFEAEPVADFVQFFPDEGENPSESTEVYILQDRENLYVAFRCFQKSKADIRITQKDECGGDCVGIFLDTFHNGRTAYGFEVNRAGVLGDFYISDDGREEDWSYEGIWEAASGEIPGGYVVEIRIPFKSLRYSRNSSVWGVNFMREIRSLNETDYWIPMKKSEGLRVSRFGELRGISPPASGKYLEIYPVSMMRSEKIEGEKADIKPDFGLDLRWDPTPQLTIQATINPDFAQIEADPYEVNLSRYETYLTEMRPFFTEGKRIFETSGFGEMGFYSPFNIFYSRRIGKKLPGGEEVPINAGLKVIGKGERHEFGLIAVHTGEKDGEEAALYTIGSIKKQLFGNSLIELLYSGKERKGGHNRALLLSGVFRSSSAQLVTEASIADSCGVRDIAFGSGFNKMTDKYFIVASLKYTGDNYTVSEVGYVPWKGLRKLLFGFGPIFRFDTGPLREITFWAALGASKTGYDLYYGKGFSFGTNFHFRNFWGFNTNVELSKACEGELRYNSASLNFSMWSDWSKRLSGNLWTWWGRSYNYRRDYLAWSGMIGSFLRMRWSPRLNTSARISSWIELTPEGSTEEITTSIRPRVTYSLRKDLFLTLYTEHVFLKSTGDFESHRLGFLLSYNPRPKTWLYIAINDLEQNLEGKYTPLERVAVVKLRYLFYF